MATEFEIRNEEDLIRAIEMIEARDWPDDLTPRFVDWPRYEITLRGEDFDGGVPTRIMPVLLKLQRAIERGYARGAYGEERRLSRREKRQVEFVVRLEPGSTKFVSDLSSALNNALMEAIKNMSGTESVIVVLSLAALAAGGISWKMYLNAQAKKHELDHRVRLSEEETKRQDMLTRLVERYPSIAANQADIDDGRSELMKRLDDRDVLMIDGEELVDGRIGRDLARKEKPQSVQDRLDGTFVILSVESGRIRDGFRVRVRELGTDRELAVSIPEGTLPKEHISDLQSGEWEKRPLDMRINVERVGEKILKATLISAGLTRD